MTREELKTWITGTLFDSKGGINGAKSIAYMQRNHPGILTDIYSTTSFLPEEATFRERVYTIVNDVTERPRCKTCCVFVPFSVHVHRHAFFCSAKCSNADPEVLRKNKENGRKYFQDNFGVNSCSQLPENKAKISATWAKKTKEERQAITQKIQNTNMERRGSVCASGTADYKAKVKKTIGVECVFQLESVKQKTKERCQREHGRDSYQQLHIPLESLRLLEDKDWLFNKHVKEQVSVKRIAADLGVSRGTVKVRMKRFGIKVHLFYSSPAEKDLKLFVNLENTLCNSHKIIPPLELDLYLPDFKLGIEYDGLFRHSSFDEESDEKKRFYHLMKTNMCEAKGIQLLHIFETEWIKPIGRAIWESLIDTKLGRNQVVKTMDVREVHDVQAFLENNHLEGPVQVETNLGLFYNNELVSLACFSGNTLLRHCHKNGYSVGDSLQVLLKAYGKDVTYLANRRWNYFPGLETTEPFGQWYRNNRPIENESGLFDDKKRRIWDCGSWIYNWKRSS